MNAVRSTFVSGMLVIALLLSAAPPGAADHCTNLLGAREWLCHPNPDVSADLSECLDLCVSHHLDRVDPNGGSLPGAWRVNCEVVLPVIGPVHVNQLFVGDAPDCIQGNLVSVEDEYLPPSDDGPGMSDLVTLTAGICEITATVMVYGFGIEDHNYPVPCVDAE